MKDINYYKKYEPIDGKWYLEEQLGKGAYGTVFRVVRKDFGEQRAAMKIVSIPATQSEFDTFRQEHYELDENSITSYFYGFVEEFVKEFQLMATLKGHSNIVSYEDHDVKRREDAFGWDIFIRMELLTPLTEHFKDHAPTESDIIKIGIDICKALEVCKKHNIIHRDIKPANIFISDDGNYKLGDFGVARTLEKTSSGLSKKGTYVYMAPEVYRGESYNLTVDLYSLGILMYRQLNDNFEPFRTGLAYSNGEEALERRMRGERFQPPKYASPALAGIILKACEFNPKDRFASPTEMREALESLAAMTRTEVRRPEATVAVPHIAPPPPNPTSRLSVNPPLRMTVPPPVAPPAPAAQQKMFCTSCGTPYNDGQSFCTCCKAPLNRTADRDGTVSVANQAVGAGMGYGNPSGQPVGGYADVPKKTKADKSEIKGKNHPIVGITLLLAALATLLVSLFTVIPFFGGGSITGRDMLTCIHAIATALTAFVLSIPMFVRRRKGVNLIFIIAVIVLMAAAIIASNVIFANIYEGFKL